MDHAITYCWFIITEYMQNSYVIWIYYKKYLLQSCGEYETRCQLLLPMNECKRGNYDVPAWPTISRTLEALWCNDMAFIIIVTIFIYIPSIWCWGALPASSGVLHNLLPCLHALTSFDTLEKSCLLEQIHIIHSWQKRLLHPGMMCLFSDYFYFISPRGLRTGCLV